ncbi:hypothetical protein, partial [Phenylobacterium sp.]|uniref:hypothetical protein n=1 Tax=Phenylobacterium sp. TaxID=1871053 RepID=UPI0035AFCD48
MQRPHDRGSALEAERFFELWKQLEDDLETQDGAGLAAVRQVEAEPAACRPLAPSWGLAGAVFLGDRPLWTGPAWRDLFCEAQGSLPPIALRPPRTAIAYAPLPDRRGQPALTAFARAPV